MRQNATVDTCRGERATIVSCLGVPDRARSSDRLLLLYDRSADKPLARGLQPAPIETTLHPGAPGGQPLSRKFLGAFGRKTERPFSSTPLLPRAAEPVPPYCRTTISPYYRTYRFRGYGFPYCRTSTLPYGQLEKEGVGLTPAL